MMVTLNEFKLSAEAVLKCDGQHLSGNLFELGDDARLALEQIQSSSTEMLSMISLTSSDGRELSFERTSATTSYDDFLNKGAMKYAHLKNIQEG